MIEKDQMDQKKTIDVFYGAACSIGVKPEEYRKLIDLSDALPRQTEKSTIIDGNRLPAASERFLRDHNINQAYNFWNTFGIGIPTEEFPPIQSWNEE